MFRRPASRWHFGIAQISILAVKSLERRPSCHFKLNTSRQPRLKRSEFPAPFFPLLSPLFQFSLVQQFSRVRLFATPWTAACQASLSIINSRRFTQTHVHSVGDAIQPSHPLSSPSPLALPSVFPSIRVFSNKPALLIRWPNTGVSASASVLPMNIQD